jgi:poly(hydroxyalkanoate) depolymerase family esterase
VKRRSAAGSWARLMHRSVAAMTRLTAASGHRALAQALKPLTERLRPPAGAGTWIPGAVMGRSGILRFKLYRPPGIGIGERLPLMVMLHGCGQDAHSFAASTRMNRLAQHERFLVLYPEQDRLANGQGCWNWFDTAKGRAQGEAALIMQSVDQVCLLQSADRDRVAIAGLSSGASMAALVGTRYPDRFKAVVMHSGVPPGTAHSGMSALGAMRGRRPMASPATHMPAPPTRWPPLLAIHGDADAIVSPHNSLTAAEFWSQAGGARAGSVRRVRRGKRYPMTITDYKHGRSTVSSLVAVAGLGHAWSGGTAGRAFSDARGPDASRMAWAFAAKQFRA